MTVLSFSKYQDLTFNELIALANKALSEGDSYLAHDVRTELCRRVAFAQIEMGKDKIIGVKDV